MLLRFAPCIAAAALCLVGALAGLQPAWAQTPPPAATSPTDKSAEPFAEDTTLTAKTIVYVKGSGVWDSAFETISGAFKKLKTSVDKEGLKTDGPQMTISLPRPFILTKSLSASAPIVKARMWALICGLKRSAPVFPGIA